MHLVVTIVSYIYVLLNFLFGFFLFDFFLFDFFLLDFLFLDLLFFCLWIRKMFLLVVMSGILSDWNSGAFYRIYQDCVTV